MTQSRWLFGGTIFLGSFLLFLVEPIAAKQLLPMLGGSAVCLDHLSRLLSDRVACGLSVRALALAQAEVDSAFHVAASRRVRRRGMGFAHLRRRNGIGASSLHRLS